MKFKSIDRWLIVIGILLIAGAFIVVTRPSEGVSFFGRAPAPRKGFPAPALSLPDLNGRNVSLSDHLGSVVILNFWTSWCPPCRAEMPAFDALYREYRARGLVVLAVNAGDQDPLPDMLAFLSPLGLSFPILRDDTGDSLDLYDINSFPTTFIIDRKGIIQQVEVGGPLSAAGLAVRIQPLIEAAP